MPRKFVLVSDTDPNCHVELDTEFEFEDTEPDAEEMGLWSCAMYGQMMLAAHAEALQRLGYSIAVVKKDLDNDE